MSEAEQERAAIVDWLRWLGDAISEEAIIDDSTVSYARGFQLISAAKCIERGEHLRTNQEGDS